MNLMYSYLNNLNFKCKNEKIVNKYNNLVNSWKNQNIIISNKYTKIGNTHYYYNCLPLIAKNRDVLKKPVDCCEIYLNWKNQSFDNMSTDDILRNLKKQYGWVTTIVDAEHKRNKFKNKNVIWAIFDTEEDAKYKMDLFNSMFITEIEIDCIEEYKKFKQNPDKKPLTFDKLCKNAYELYDQVDKGLL